MRLAFAPWDFALAFTLACLFAAVKSSSDTSQKPHKPTFTFDQLWNLEKNFWDSFLYPANLEQTQGNAFNYLCIRC
jgi:hypothetical protein